MSELSPVNPIRLSVQPVLVDTAERGVTTIEDEEKRYWNMLVESVPDSGYVPPVGRQTVILDVACGSCIEARVLNVYFGGNEFGHENNNVRLVGIDEGQYKIDEARSSFPPPRYEFFRADATRLDESPQPIPEAVDVLVLRHPNCREDHDKWAVIFQQSISRLTQDGILLCTTYAEQEHLEILDLLSELNCDVVVSRFNENTGPNILGDPSIEASSRDRYVVVAKKSRDNSVPDPSLVVG